MSMVLVQQPTQRTAAFRERIARSAANKHEEIMCRCAPAPRASLQSRWSWLKGRRCLAQTLFCASCGLLC